ncbi:MAG: hypothetical protein AB1405_11830, partial [Bdellovibrionota bacterium]
LNIGLRGTPRIATSLREERERERREKELPPEEKPTGPPGPPGHKDELQEEKPPQSQDRPVEGEPAEPSEPKEREFEWSGGDSSFHFTLGAFGQAPMDFDVPVAAFGGLSLGIGGEDVEFDVDVAFGDARRYASGIFVIGLRLRGYMGGSIENGEEVIRPYLVAGFWGVEGFNRYDFNGDAISDEIVSLGFDLGLGLEARDADSRSAFFLEILYTAVEEEFVYIDDPINFAHTLGLRGGVRWRWP